MNKMVVTLFVLFLQVTGMAQIDHKRIKISNELELIQLSKNSYIHTSQAVVPKYGKVSANGLIYINSGKALMINTPWTDSQTRDLFLWIKDSMKLELIGVIPTHWHSDCMGGLNYLKKMKIESYANQVTIEIARTKNLPVPTRGFVDSLQLKIGNKMVDCYYPGAAHTLDNIVVWIPSEQLLFAGCIVKSVESTDLGNIADGDLTAYPTTIDKLLLKFKSAKIVIPGHGQFGGPELITHTRDLLAK